MAKKAVGGFGIVILVIVMAVVLLLVAQSWKKVAPTAIEADRVAGGVALDAHGQDDAAAELRSGDLPKISDMAQETDAHTERVKEALAEAE